MQSREKTQLQRAVSAVMQHKMKIRVDAREFNVPRSTLSDHVHGRVGETRTVIEAARANDVVQIAFPGHTTHILMPLDVKEREKTSAEKDRRVAQRALEDDERKRLKEQEEIEKIKRKEEHVEKRLARKQERKKNADEKRDRGKLANKKFTCGVCCMRGRVLDKSKGIVWFGCDEKVCGKWFHFECFHRSEQEYLRESMEEGESWYCKASIPFCLNAAIPFCLNAAIPFCLNAAIPFCLNAAIPFCLNAAIPFCLNAAIDYSRLRSSNTHGSMYLSHVSYVYN
ncbi:hypothetical protein DPMN_073847 [Dreissena polymorpha]|uniref:HTH psq-type domain-containing protein n=1 Tax=Dreissena polymorpha TaxID=45954 RepID=A0A9D3YDU6_DREPO|nr:hypothetical protein DPMN_073847 [Dreissena polymorpha]